MNPTSSRHSARTVTAFVVKLCVAIGISVALLAWVFRDVDVDKLKDDLLRSDPWVIAWFCAGQFAIHLVRVVRWGVLIRAIKPLTRRSVFTSASVGLPAAMFLPLRLGEFVRPALVARDGVSFASGMAAVVAERVFDGLTNVGLLFLMLAFVRAEMIFTEELQFMTWIAAIGFGGASLFLVLLLWSKDFTLHWTARVTGSLSEALAKKVTGMLSMFIDGLRPLRQPRRLVAFVALTAVYWSLNGFLTTMLTRSYGADVPWMAGPFAIVIVVFLITVPAGPAFTGTLHAGFSLGLAPFGVTATQAVAVGTAVYLIQIATQAIILVLGLLAVRRPQN